MRCFIRVLMFLVCLATAVGLLIYLSKTGNSKWRKKQLRDLVIAMHNYQNDHGHLPQPAVFSKEGKPLLSWRVLLLPYLGQEPLFKQFRLNETWDSENNRILIEKMPGVYKVPGAIETEIGKTYYQIFVSPNVVKDFTKHQYKYEPQFSLDPNKKKRLEIIKMDGAESTFAIAEAGSAVIWTKPEDLVVEHDDVPLPKLGCTGGDLFGVGCFDGAVLFVRKPGRGKGDHDKLMRQMIGWHGYETE